MTENPKPEAALEYASLRVYVFPLHNTDAAGACSCGRTDCHSAGKHPRTEHGHLDATTDPAQIRRWWTAWPDANIGIATGPSGLIVIDVDDREGRHGTDVWRVLVEKLGPRLKTRRSSRRPRAVSMSTTVLPVARSPAGTMPSGPAST